MTYLKLSSTSWVSDVSENRLNGACSLASRSSKALKILLIAASSTGRAVSRQANGCLRETRFQVEASLECTNFYFSLGRDCQRLLPITSIRRWVRVGRWV